MLQRIQAFDWKMVDWIYHKVRNKKWNTFFVSLTKVGDAGFVWFIIICILFLAKIYRQAAITAFVSLVVSAVFGNFIMKNIFKRPRPFTLKPGYDTLVSLPQDYSFPSGHTYSSFAAATAIVLYAPILGSVALVLALAIAFSRLYLCVHFFSDVMTSILLGVGTAFLIRFILATFFF